MTVPTNSANTANTAITDLHKQDTQFLLNNYGRINMHFVKGSGARLWDNNGNEYLDFVSGIAVNAFGHAPQMVQNAIQEQMQNFIHLSNLFPLQSQVDLAALLVQNSWFDKVFFGNSGTEANEAAIKFARKYFYRQGQAERYEIITLQKSFHGRTYGGMAATGQDSIKEGFGPVLPGFVHIELNNSQELRAAVHENTCAVMLEPLLAEGGLLQLNADFVQTLNELKDEYGFIVIADEIQTGMGRLGTLWGAEYLDLRADIMTLAKPLGGGLPLSAVLMTEEIAQNIKPGDHGSTFGGNPIACAVGKVILEKLMEPGFLKQVQEKAKTLDGLLVKILDKHETALELRGRGLLRGIQVQANLAEVMGLCRQKGLLIARAGTDVLRLIPPLIVSEEELQKAVGILDAVLSEV